MPVSDLQCVQRTLDSGLRLCVVPMPTTHRTVLHAQLSVGSRFEQPDDAGLGHFLEHMLYRGTERYPSAHDLSLAIERRGGSLDATTACDTGTLTLHLPSRQLPELLPVFADVYCRPVFTGLDIEKGIVREEILEALDDDGERIDADDLIRDLVFTRHPLGAPIIGTLDHLERFDVERLREHHRRFYCASNTVVVAAGPLSAEATLDSLSEHFSALPAGAPPTCSPPPAQTQGRFKFVRHSSSQTSLRLGFRAPGWGDGDQGALELLLGLLDDGMSTRLYHRICDELGLCYDVSAGYEAYTDSGLLELSAETSHQQADEVLRELLQILATLRDEGPGDAELAAAIARRRWESEAMLDEPASMAEYVASAIQNGQPVSLEARTDQLAAVTLADLRSAAARWLRPECLSVVAVGMLNKSERRNLEQTVSGFTALSGE